MTYKWNSSTKCDDIRNNPFSNSIWEKSFSEPDLTGNPYNLNDRFRIKNLHEHVSVDQLKYFRRKKHLDFPTKSNICLSDKKDALPFSSLKTEYQWRYRWPPNTRRSKSRRRSTSLKLEGQMRIQTEQRSKYVPYSDEELIRGRQPGIRNPENLTLRGDIELNPESRSAFIHHHNDHRRQKCIPVEKFKIHGDINLTQPITEKKMAHGTKAQKCHLKLEGQMNCLPEYRSQYIPFSVEKSHSIPQLSNIRFNGEFTGIPEYRDSFRLYDNYSKSAPIKKPDHIILNGQLEPYPDYTEKYKPPKYIERAELLKTEDHLRPEGEFSKDIPEYFESFKDPEVKEMPERGKCRETSLKLKGKIEFDPEYKNTYVDFPRSRPILKKATTNLEVSKSPFTPKKKFQPNLSNPPYHDQNADLEFTDTPEYRRAQHLYQIRERTPTREKSPLFRKVTETKPIQKKKSKNPVICEESGSTEYDTAIRKKNARKKDTALILSKMNNLENIENLIQPIKKPSPKFGRRAPILRNAKNNRDRTSIIEGNPKYFNKIDKNKQKLDETPFFILDQPYKKNNWMKKSWYEA